MARIVIFGGTGYAGSSIAREAASRGHEVISYSRNAPAQPLDAVEYRIGSLASPAVVTAAAAAADQLVVAVHGADVDGAPLVTYLPQLIEAARSNGVRLSFVGADGFSPVADGGPPPAGTPGFHPHLKRAALRHLQDLGAPPQAHQDHLPFFQ